MLPFERLPNESDIEWLMCQQYCLQIKRDRGVVFRVNNFPYDEGLAVAKRFLWDERSLEFDKWKAQINHRGRIDCHATMEKNTTMMADLLKSHLEIYQSWVDANRDLLDENFEVQARGVKTLGSLSRINLEVTQAFTQQQDIDLALEQLAKEIE